MALLFDVPINQLKIWFLLFVVVAPGFCRVFSSDRNRLVRDSEPILPPPLPVFYDFSYRVKSPKHKNDYGHSEKRVGDVVTGNYRVLLPDGRTQVVNYYVDPTSGYVAKVTYE